MSLVKELISSEVDGTISFGDYQLDKKTKREDFEFNGDLYKVKTFYEITRLEKNGMFVFESVPGTTVSSLAMDEEGMKFIVEGGKDAQITVELEEDTVYSLCIHGKEAGQMKTNLGGKLSFNVELEDFEQVAVEIVKA